MADQTNIEWCDSTFNPWIGCTRVSPACDDCYAARSTPARTLGVAWGTGEPRRLTSDANWKLPQQWQRQAGTFYARHGRRRRVFCASLADVFDNEVDPGWRSNLLRLILDTPALDWLLLTKRIGNVTPMLAEISGDLQLVAHHAWTGALPPNVWLGITVVNQTEADRDVPKLLRVPAAVRFLSVEPMLGPIDLQRSCTACCANKGVCFRGGPGERLVVDSESGGYTMECICSRLNGLHWVICGGESGPKARPMHPDWARSLRDQCAAAGVSFLFKQWGQWLPAGQDGDPQAETTHINASSNPIRIGKKAAGRQLDGRTHDAWPACAA